MRYFWILLTLGCAAALAFADTRQFIPRHAESQPAAVEAEALDEGAATPSLSPSTSPSLPELPEPEVFPPPNAE
jgi:hypothetical protein